MLKALDEAETVDTASGMEPVVTTLVGMCFHKSRHFWAGPSLKPTILNKLTSATNMDSPSISSSTMRIEYSLNPLLFIHACTSTADQPLLCSHVSSSALISCSNLFIGEGFWSSVLSHGFDAPKPQTSLRSAVDEVFTGSI